MSYRLGCTEKDAEVKKAVNEVQEYFNVQEKREWVEWVGKTLILHLHMQITMEKTDMARAEQEELEEL
jgi:predicted Co/Zn/Cd cation transporter (cation efflux family)